MSDTARIEPVTKQTGASAEAGYPLLEAAIERWADQIEAATEALGLAVRLVEQAAACRREPARPLWKTAERLADRLRAQLAAALAWRQAVSEDGAIDALRLESALTGLRSIVGRASILLLVADIVLAAPDPVRSVALGDLHNTNGRRRARRQLQLFTTVQRVTETLTGHRARVEADSSAATGPAAPRPHVRAA
jgi:hypothetical protein